MSKLIGSVLVLLGVALAALAATLGEPSEAAPELAASLRIEPGDQELAMAEPQAAPIRRPLAPFQTTTILEDPATLTRELQKELRRVGCYAGEVSGLWSPQTRKAMQAFNRRVNARLPLDKPDQVLLTLVQGHADRVCGEPCPVGQAAVDGRCVPHAVIASRSKATAEQVLAATRAKAVTRPVETISELRATAAQTSSLPTVLQPGAQLPDGSFQHGALPFADIPRMALAGPQQADQTAQQKTASVAVEPARKARKLRHRERRNIAEGAPRRSKDWARELFYRLDNGIF